MSGKTTCKEVCSTCKCTVIEKPISKEKNDCVATIVGVLSLPENFCKQRDPCEDKCEDTCEDKCEEDSCDVCEEKQDDCCEEKTDDCCEEKKDLCCEEKDECAEVYRDLGECIKKAIVKTTKAAC